METRTFSGGVFDASLPDGRAGAKIRLTAIDIVATTDDGKAFSLPLSGLNLEVGGASGRMVFCRDTSRNTTIFSEEKEFSGALRAAAGGKVEATLDAIAGQVRASRRRALRWWAIGTVALVIALVGAYQGTRAGARFAVRKMPIEIDRKLGDAAFATMPPEGPRLSDTVVVGAIDKIVARLKPTAGQPMDFRVTVVNAPIVNAFCLPGGQIVVFTGLILEAGDPEQVAAVLGHEMAHATLRHGLERIAHSIGITVAAQVLLGDVQGLIALAAQLSGTGILTSYGREQESEADAEGLRMAHAAGIDGRALGRFFSTLERAHGDVPAGLAWLSSHPQLVERRAAVERVWSGLGTFENKPLDIDWTEVQRHARSPDPTSAAPAPTRVDTTGAKDEDGRAKRKPEPSPDGIRNPK